MHVCHVQKLHAARPDSVLKGSSGHALLCGQRWSAHQQAQRKRRAVLKIVNQDLLFIRNWKLKFSQVPRRHADLFTYLELQNLKA